MSRPYKYQWRDVDWSMSNVEIASKLGASYKYVYNKRKLHAPTQHQGYTCKRYNWDAVDWSKRTSAIAVELGCSASLASTRRRLNAPAQHRKSPRWSKLQTPEALREYNRLAQRKHRALARARRMA